MNEIIDIVKEAVVISILGFLYIIAWRDIKVGMIPNQYLKYLGMSSFFFMLLTDNIAVLDRIIGILIISMPMLLITLIFPGSFGGGDIKLMAVCGFFLGWEAILSAFWIALFLAAIFSICLLQRGKGLKAEFPLGPFLCGGVAIKILQIF